MFVDPCIIVQFIKQIQQVATLYQNFIFPYLYEAQHFSGDTPPIIRSLKLHWQLLFFIRVELLDVQMVDVVRLCLTTSTICTSNNSSRMKNKSCQCSFRLLMMGGVSPETCWASYKYGKIKFWYSVATCWIFFMNYELWMKSLRQICIGLVCPIQAPLKKSLESEWFLLRNMIKMNYSQAVLNFYKISEY